MLIIFLAILTVLLFGATYALWKTFHINVAEFTAVVAGLTGIVAFAFLLVFVLVRIPVNAANKRAELDARYQALTYAVTQDSAKSVALAEDIADYNADVRKGRNLMHSFCSCMTYTFWDEVPLIEYGES